MSNFIPLFKKDSAVEGKNLERRHRRLVEEARALERRSSELLKLAQKFRISPVLS